MTVHILGGLGLFLVGMVLMLNGLKTLGGDALRRVLTRFSGGTLSGILSGLAITSLVQASSATILATIGFVSAGLMSFTQSIAIIFGANLGTTVTGWMVTMLGFKLGIGSISMPIVAAGGLMMLLARGKNNSLGMVIAGFGMLFVGIDMLQSGMQRLAVNLDPAILPGTGWCGRLALVGAGMLITIATQSSSAALFTSLSALHTGSIGLEQAAALVIGLSIGKTSTAVLASIKASVQARRAALAHIIFNLFTCAIVFLFFDIFLGGVRNLCLPLGVADDSILLAAFYSGLNLFGILALFPFIPQISILIERLIPERVMLLTRNLDDTVAKLPDVAIEASRRTVITIAALLIGAMRGLVDARDPNGEIKEKIEDAGRALAEIGRFLGKVRTQPGLAGVHARHLSVLHAVEHLERLAEACRETDDMDTVGRVDYLRAIALEKLRQIHPVLEWLQGYSRDLPLEIVETVSRSIAGIRRMQRAEVLELTARGSLKPDEAMRQLEAMRWLDRVAYHIWRAIYHLSEQLQERVEMPDAGFRESPQVKA